MRLEIIKGRSDENDVVVLSEGEQRLELSVFWHKDVPQVTLRSDTHTLMVSSSESVEPFRLLSKQMIDAMTGEITVSVHLPKI